MTALSPGSNEANRSVFPPMHLSGFLRFFFRKVLAIGSFLVPCVRFAFVFSTELVKFPNNQLQQVESRRCVSILFQTQQSFHIFYTPTFKFQGLGSGGRNMFFEQHGINKKPALSLFSPSLRFLSHLVSVHWFLPTTPSANQCDKH